MLGLFPTNDELLHMKNTISPTGVVTFSDFTRLFADSQLNYNKEEQFREIFKAIDRNCDGFIGTDEIKYLMNVLQIPIERKEIEEMLKQYKGEIGFVAFCKLMGRFDITQ